MLLGKNFDAIDGDTIKSLIDEKVHEKVNLEFKRDTYGKNDKGKGEFLKDISAFANTLGGYLIIGVDENDGVAASVKPISGNIDDELQRLENMARTGIEPTITGLRMKRIDNENIIVIHVPRSFNPPHRVILNRSNRYYGRNSSGVYELSLEELRGLFGEQRSIEERAKAFIGQRFLSIQANDGMIPLPTLLPLLVMHLVPLPDFGAGRQVEVNKIMNTIEVLELQYSQTIYFVNAGYPKSIINLDGYCFYNGEAICRGYTQIFRNGAIEATDASLFGHIKMPGNLFLANRCPDELTEILKNYMVLLRALEVTPPILLQISMMSVKGIKMETKFRSTLDKPIIYNRDVLHLPPSVITEFRDDENYQSVMAKQMHFLWNAFGLKRCLYFGESDE